MKVAKYWARETTKAEDATGLIYDLVSWSGSNLDLDSAKAKAKEKLNLRKTLLRNSPGLESYPYEDRDEIREELIEAHHDDDDRMHLAITRNRYGALVLNSASVLFADVDLVVPPKVKLGTLGKLRSIFQSNKAEPDIRQERRIKCLDGFADFHRQNPGLSLRVYETAAGFRLVVTNKLYDPLGDEMQTVLKQLKSDKLYIRLCRSQECFRARLTPKPWRCGFKGPPNSFPREDANQHTKYSSWLKEYEKKSEKFGVCRLVDEYQGSERANEITANAVKSVLQLHDSHVLNSSSQLLA